MKTNKLLERQLRKAFPEGIPDDPALQKLMEAVNNSYNSFERDSLLSKHIFSLTENDYLTLNQKLSEELQLKKDSIQKLRELMQEFSGSEFLSTEEELPAILAYLKKEVGLRVRAEEQLSTAAHRLYSLIVHMQNGVLVEDESRHILLTNQYFCDMFGIPLRPESMIGMDCSGTAEQNKHLFRNPEEFVKRIEKLVHEKKPAVNDELELIDGRFFSRDFIPIYEGTDYRGHYWKYTDITEQKLNLRKVEESELKNRLIMDGSLDAIITVDLAGIITFWNKQSEKIFGFSSSAVLGRPLAEVIIPERYREQHRIGMAHYRKTGEGQMLNKKAEIFSLRNDGTEFPAEITIVPIRQGGTEFFVSFMRDITERKKTEENLRMTSLVASLNRNGVLFTDMNGRITWCNTGFTTQIGYPISEIISKTPVELLRGEQTDIARLRDLLLKFYTGENFTEELICYRKDRSWFWARISGQYIKGEDGHITQYFAVMEDITREKLAQERIMQFNNHFRQALEKIGDNVWDHDFQTGVTEFSSKSNQLLGYKKPVGKQTSKLWWDRIHPDDKYLVEASNEAYVNGTQDHHILEYRLIAKDGKVYWVLDRGVVIERDEQGKALRIMGTHTNITERKLAESKLRFNEEKYRSIIANMNLGLLEVDPEEVIQFANQSFCEMCGYEMEEIIGQKASRLFTHGENKKRISNKNELRELGVSDAYELPVQNKRGELKWWLVSGAPRYNDRGEYAGSIGIHLDITDQKKLELELSVAREAAEQSARSKEVFLANMSHEIRTPMNAILGMASQLLKTTLDERQRFFLNTVNTAGEHLLVIINDILDISKIEAGKLLLEEIPFQPGVAFKHAIQVMQHRAEEKGLTIEYTPDEQIAPVLKGDPHRINQILLNLISNSVKFTESGFIRIKTSLLAKENDRQLIRICVEDTGVGMSEEFQSNLFQVFTQEEKTVARKYGGTGLGMAISKQLVELMGGHIEVFSEKGKGTRVALTIPFRTGQAIENIEEPNAVSDVSTLKGKRILLVEDNELNRLVATTVLHQYEVSVTEVENGQLALDALRTNPYDLVLMDMQMPVMDGLEATRIIRAEINQHIPIIALTANAIKGESNRCLQAGMNDYLAKPFKEDDLLQILVQWISNGPHKKQTESDTSTVEAEAPLYDLSVLEKISNQNPEFVNKMVQLFIAQVPEAVAEITVSFRSGDFKRVKALAHRIKPSIDNMGIKPLHPVVRDIERMAMQDSGNPELEIYIKKLDSVISEVVTQMLARQLTIYPV